VITARKVLLIIPCYNEEKRLPIREFLRFVERGHHLLFADDGSTDGTVALIEKLFQNQKNIRLYKASMNKGKAEVIRSAVIELNRIGIPHDVEWVGYWDADLATPLDEVEYLMEFQRTFSSQSKAMMGARVLRLGGDIRRSTFRHYLGRGFATVASMMLGIRCYDSQCGAKLFHKSLLPVAFGEPFISQWVFDVEILLRIGESMMIEVPLRRWEDVPGSKVKIGREFLRVMLDLLRMRGRYVKPGAK